MVALRPHKGYDEGANFRTVNCLSDYNRIHQLDFSALVQEQGLYAGSTIDIGSGNCNFLRDLSREFPRMRVTGVDKKNYQASIPNFIVADARAIPLPSQQFDFVVSSIMSQWIREEPELFYCEVRRLLSPRGVATIFPCTSPTSTLDVIFKDSYRVRPLTIKDCPSKPLQLFIGNPSFLNKYTS